MRFQVGEIAKFVVARTANGYSVLNQVCEVTFLHPRQGVIYGGMRPTEDADYVVNFGGEPVGRTVMDWQLQKLNPPEEPVALTHHAEVEA